MAPDLPLVQLEPLQESSNSHCKKECPMPATAPATYVGLDIAKARLDYTLDPTHTAGVPNDPHGHQQLIRWLQQQPHPR